MQLRAQRELEEEAGLRAEDWLPLARVFTTPGVHPYDDIVWESRDVVQTNWKTNETVFEQRGVEFPDFWSVNAYTIVTTKYFRETLAEWSAGGAAADVGVFYAWPVPHITIGASVQNLGADVSFDGVEEPLPTTMRGGASVAFAIVPAVAEMRVASDVVKPRFENLYVSAGAELALSGMLFIRAGWCGREYRQGDGLTLGGGAKILERLQLDYAYTPYGDLGEFHRIALHVTLP